MSSDAVAGDSSHVKKGQTDREFQHDGPVEDEETAREKMEEAGFDPDDVTKECELNEHAMESFGLHEKMHPMTY